MKLLSPQTGFWVACDLKPLIVYVHQLLMALVCMRLLLVSLDNFLTLLEGFTFTKD